MKAIGIFLSVFFQTWIVIIGIGYLINLLSG